jgi:hypothetical protein
VEPIWLEDALPLTSERQCFAKIKKDGLQLGRANINAWLDLPTVASTPAHVDLKSASKQP